jgi:SDR family mycofactocin-dependent oxidoreductase
MGKFDGKVVFITGGARGQGRSHALAFAREGADIVITDLAKQTSTIPYAMSTEDNLNETTEAVESLDRRCVSIVADARDSNAMRDATQAAVEEFGKLDILIVNHGVVSLSPIADMSDETWDDTISTNLTGVFKTIRAALPHMVKQGSGRILVTASMAAAMGIPTIGHYVASKWGVVGLVKSVALEVAKHNITVNAVSPTNCNTDMIHHDAFYKLFAPDLENATREQVAPSFASLHPLPDVPWIEPIDISNAMLFLASDEARFITGEVMHVSAGWIVQNVA